MALKVACTSPAKISLLSEFKHNDLGLFLAGETASAGIAPPQAEPMNLLPELMEQVAERFPLSWVDDMARLPENLSSLQLALLHEVAATSGLQFEERMRRVVLSLGIPPTTILSTLDGLVKASGFRHAPWKVC